MVDLCMPYVLLHTACPAACAGVEFDESVAVDQQAYDAVYSHLLAQDGERDIH